MSVKVTCPFIASLLHFAGYWLFQTTATEGRGETTYHFEMNDWSYEELRAAYDSEEGQSVSNIARPIDFLMRSLLPRQVRVFPWVQARSSCDGVLPKLGRFVQPLNYLTGRALRVNPNSVLHRLVLHQMSYLLLSVPLPVLPVPINPD